MWANTYPAHFGSNQVKIPFDEIISAAQKDSNVILQATAKNVLNSLAQQEKDGGVGLPDSFNNANTNIPLLGVKLPDWVTNNYPKSAEFMQFPEKAFAEQLTAYEMCLFKLVEPRELLFHAWQKGLLCF